jgi:Cdc6-like AAA superfamily ATPase
VPDLSQEKSFRRGSLLCNPLVESDLFFERKKEKAALEVLLDNWMRTQSKTEIVVHGDHQAGKTHLLHYLHGRLLRKLGAEAESRVVFLDFNSIVSFQNMFRKTVETLWEIEFLKDFLTKIKQVPVEEINYLTGNQRFSRVCSRLGYDASKVGSWIQGQLSSEEAALLGDSRDPQTATQILQSLLRALILSRGRSHPLYFVDHQDEMLTDSQNMIRDGIKQDMRGLLRVLLANVSFVMGIKTSSLDCLRRSLHPISDGFTFHRIDFLDVTGIDDYLEDMRNEFVDRDAMSAGARKKVDGEEVEQRSHPLTIQAETYLKRFHNLHSGTLSAVLDKAWKECLEKHRSFISQQVLERIIRERFPELLLVCERCRTPLRRIKILFSTARPGRKGHIVGVTCEICEIDRSAPPPNVKPFLPFLMKRVVLDTSALVDFALSMLMDDVPTLGSQDPVEVLIPKAVDGELSHWDKLAGKRDVRNWALMEQDCIRRLASRKRAYLSERVGREPTYAEIMEAEQLNRIDMIIVDVAMANRATLLTCDRDQAVNASKRGVFTLHFSRESTP